MLEIVKWIDKPNEKKGESALEGRYGKAVLSSSFVNKPFILGSSWRSSQLLKKKIMNDLEVPFFLLMNKSFMAKFLVRLKSKLLLKS